MGLPGDGSPEVGLGRGRGRETDWRGGYRVGGLRHGHVRGSGSCLPETTTDPGAGMAFDHERLDVYRISIHLVAAVHSVTARIERGYADLIGQARRAAISIPLNIAEGSGEFSALEKVRFYRIARRSATECAAALDVLHALTKLTDEDLRLPRQLLDRTVAMLTALIKQKENPARPAVPSPRPRPSPRAGRSPPR